MNEFPAILDDTGVDLVITVVSRRGTRFTWRLSHNEAHVVHCLSREAAREDYAEHLARVTELCREAESAMSA